ncbi:uncharacterized protein [Solanum tuberosum]|uniref:DUF7950 domain-containing protein n=1 Tax=Solanum tuberosum TaxID=4113 RepID=M1B826_SOLTU|nr:PREDICTED: uncharacterized protein LOC102590433 [Solanum tuberosum]KAH0703132.1 hypothetical protein KY285_017410 [Solanum tuberosum]
MDGRGGCCIARYAGGAYDMSKVDRIMLKFRPIAPKPAAAGSSVSGTTTPPQKTEVPVRTGRWKRRYVKENNKNSNNSKRSNSGSSPSGRKRKAPSPEENESSGKTVSGGETVVTLPLLSESPERKDRSVDVVKKNSPIWLSFGGNQENNNGQSQGYGGVMFPQPVRVVGSWVKVESVTDAWVEGYGLGRTDEEKLINLERDSCPGFISDGLNRVRWANKAYKAMVGEGAGEVVVWLVMKDDVRLPDNKSTAAFTCRVRVVRCGKEKNSLILPCDVWRMDGGGFAWRLDTEAALSLGRYVIKVISTPPEG